MYSWIPFSVITFVLAYRLGRDSFLCGALVLFSEVIVLFVSLYSIMQLRISVPWFPF